MAGPNLTPRPDIPGQYNIGSETNSNVKYLYLAKQEAFTVNVYGLMPFTLHYVFFDNKRVSASNIKPLNKAIGDSLFTDRNGQAQFVFYFQSEVVASSSEEEYNDIAHRLGGDKTLVVANSVDSLLELPSAFDTLFSSYTVKNITFKTTPVSELPVNSTYTLAYPYVPPPPPPEPYDWGPGSAGNDSGVNGSSSDGDNGDDD